MAEKAEKSVESAMVAAVKRHSGPLAPTRLFAIVRREPRALPHSVLHRALWRLVAARKLVITDGLKVKVVTNGTPPRRKIRVRHVGRVAR